MRNEQKSTAWAVVLSSATLIACASGAQTGSGWVNHQDPSGFAVRFPAGWAAEAAKDGHVVIHSSDGSVFAVLQPFKMPQGGNPGDTIVPLVNHMSGLFHNGQVSHIQEVEGSGDEAVAKVRFTSHGNHCEANVLCYASNGGGMFYAIGAPSSVFAVKRQTLIKVLNSFQYGAPGSSEGASGSAGSGGPVRYTTWTDPKEGAFTVQVPVGWHVVGGAFRFAPVDVRKQYAVASPDGEIKIVCGDARLAAFAPYGPSAQTRGLHEGQSYSANGVTYTIMHVMDGATFSQQYAEALIKKSIPSLQVAETKNRADIQQVVEGIIAGSGGQTRVSSGEADFSFTENGKQYQGASIATTVQIGQGLGAIWMGYPSYFTAPADKMETAREVWKHLVLPKDTQAWSAKQKQITAQFNQMVMQNHEETMAMLRRQYEKFSRDLAENGRQWDNIITGSVDVRDSSGQTFHVEGGHNYYYTNGSSIVGTNTVGAPNVNFAPLTQF